MEIDWVFVFLVCSSFLAAAFNAAFSIGGAMIVLAATTAVLPVMAIVPIHSGFLIGSTFGRMFMFWRYLRWDIARPFLVGSLFGTTLGARVYFELPEQFIALGHRRGSADRDLAAEYLLAPPNQASMDGGWFLPFAVVDTVCLRRNPAGDCVARRAEPAADRRDAGGLPVRNVGI